ncbi:hypothetical protein [Arcobacter peruensis]|uniref:hypothetical protein n=1 Tax=Arcobacter peruensis TaxID=2320140 RepID=UPI000F07AE7B|nr:hypothetical protein [Arcobacter peruensis]
MNTVLVIGIITLLIICISLVVILFNINNKKKTKSNKKTVEYKSLDILNIEIPKKIEHMDEYSLNKAARVVFDSFKSLDYVNKPASSLDKVEWHTWQVSLIMALIKENKGSFVPNNSQLFHKLITNINDDLLVNETQKIVNKFNNKVDVFKGREELSQDIVWSSKDVSILFYYMARH